MTKYNRIGKIVATYGLQGEVILHHNLGKKTSLKGLEAIFIEDKKDEMLPYFLQSTKIRTADEIYLKLDGISTRESAKKLTQKEVWLTDDDFKRYAAKSAPISLLGYHLINESNDLGEILEVIEQPHQVICTVDLGGKEALIPVHEETLVKIDKKNRQVHVKLPEGLLDIFR